MQTPIYWAAEYLDASGFNASAAAVSGNFATTFNALTNAGLVRSDVVTFGSTGLVLGVTMPAPFGVVFGTGVFAAAHGVLTGQDSQTASVNLASFVPSSGTATVYVVASYQSIQQNAFQIVGPQPGHPSYNPSFIPYTAYADAVDSLAVTGQTSAPDNSTTFELCRFTLSAGATGLPAPTTGFQWIAAPEGQRNVRPATVNRSLNNSDIGVFQRADVNGLHFTLPNPALYPAAIFGVTSASGTQILQTTSGVGIFGWAGADGGSTTSLSVTSGMTVAVQSDGFKYFVVQQTGLGSAALQDSSAFDAAGAAAAVQAYVNANFLPLTGGTLSGNLAVSTSGAASVTINGASGSNHQLIWQAGGVTLFDELLNNSNRLFMRAWTSGVPVNVWTLNSSGVFGFNITPTAPNLSPNDNSSNIPNTRYVDAGDAVAYASGVAYVNGYAFPLTGGGIDGNVLVFGNLQITGTTILQGGVTMDNGLAVGTSLSVGTTLTVGGNVTATGAGAFGGNVSVSGGIVTLGDGIGAQIVGINGASGAFRSLYWMTNGLVRWHGRANNTAESGLNAGTDFSFVAYADDGLTTLWTLWSGIRSTGVMTIQRLTTTTQPSGNNSTFAATTEYADRLGFGALTIPHDVSGSRAINGGPYTNNTGRMLEVSLTFATGAGSQPTINVALINGVTQVAAVGVPISGVVMNLHGFIQAGASYQVTTNSGTGTFTGVRWIETY